MLRGAKVCRGMLPMPGPTQETFRIRLVNRFGEIERFTEAAHAYLAGAGVSDAALFNVDFCFEEVFTNIVKYGFSDERDHWIDVTADVDHDRVVLHIEDDGTPFDPKSGAGPAPDITCPIEERPIGGLGLHLVRAIAAGLEYENSGGRNRLTVCLRRSEE